MRGVWPYGDVVANKAEARVEPAEEGLDRPLGDSPADLPGIQPQPVAGLERRAGVMRKPHDVIKRLLHDRHLLGSQSHVVEEEEFVGLPGRDRRRRQRRVPDEAG